MKENEVQRRYAKAYESNYMTEQLAKLVMTVSTQVQKLRSRTTKTPSDDGAPEFCLPFSTGFLGFFQPHNATVQFAGQNGQQCYLIPCRWVGGAALRVACC